MMNWLIASPILVPLSTAVVCALFWTRPGTQRLISLIGSISLLVLAAWLLARVLGDGVLAVQMGSWAAPFGITLVVDPLAALMVLVSALMAVAVAIYALGDVDLVRERGGYHTIFQTLMVGVCGSFITGDLFNLYVWFEVMLISSFVLLSLGGTKEQIDGAIKYAGINLVATACLLLAVALVYGMTGTLNMADLALRVPQLENQGLVSTIAVLFIIAFGIKAAVFPMFFWLPAAYHTPAVAVQAIFAGLLTKAGVYALLRTFTLIFIGDTAWTHEILLWIAGATMLVGALGSLAVRDLPRLLSWQVMAHIGYMIMGLALYTPLAIAGAVFYLVHDIVVKTNLFLGAGVVKRLAGGSTAFAGLGGLFAAAPWLCLVLFVPLASLAGFPPLSGFWSKFVLVRAGLEVQSWAIVAVALVTGLLTFWAVARVWAEAVWKDNANGPVEGTQTLPLRAAFIAPLVLLSAVTVTIGFYAAPLMEVAGTAAAQLLDRQAYIEAVLGTAPTMPTMLGMEAGETVKEVAP